MQTIGEAIQRHARSTPAGPALLASGAEALSFGALHETVREARAHLNAHGIGRGDRVALAISDRAVAAAAYLALTSSAVAVPLSPKLTEAEYAALFRALRLSAVAVSEDGEAAEAAARALGLPVLLAAPSGAAAGRFRLVGGRPGDARLPGPATGADIACVQAGSGTSGRPKAAVQGHRNLLFRAERDRRLLRLTPADVTINFRPMHLSGPLNVGLLASVVAGAAVVVPQDFDADGFYEDLGRHGVTWYTGGPVYHAMLLDRAADHAAAIANGRLRFVRSAGYALPEDMELRLEETFRVPCIQKYGCAEIGMVACNPLPPGRRKPGTCGPVTDAEIRLLDDDGQEVAPGESGEIAVRAPGMFLGYDDPEMTARAVIDGFFHTGDIGAFDEDGHLSVIGRKTEIINRGGQKITPQEVERIILAHPSVAEAMCFAVPHATLGETVALAVRPAPGAEVMAGDLLDMARRSLARFKLPETVLVADALPRGPTGKPLRRAAAAHFGLTGAGADAARPPADRLARIWCEVLRLDAADEGANFTLLGGDSLRAARLVQMIEDAFGDRIDEEVVYGAGATLAGLRACLAAGASQAPSPRPHVPRRADRQAPLSLTSNQLRLWTLHHAGDGRPLYNSAFGLRFPGLSDPGLLQRALDHAAAGHEALRARFPAGPDGLPIQVFDGPTRVEMPVEDLSSLPPEAREARYLARARAAAAAPYDLETGPVFRARAFLLGEDGAALVVQSHHIVGDAMSTGVLAAELAASVAAGGAQTLCAPRPDFGDFVAWQAARLDGAETERLRAFWRGELAGADTELHLPLDRPRPAVQSRRGARLRFQMGPEVASGLRAVAARSGGALFSVAMAAFQLLARRLAGQTDFLLGIGTDERPQALRGHLVGFCIGTIPIRAQVDDKIGFLAHAGRVRAAMTRAVNHSEVPFDLLVRDHVRGPRSGVPPLIQTMFSMMPTDSRARSLLGATVDLFNFDHDRARFDLTVMLEETEAGLGGFVEYAADIFDAESARLLIDRYETLLRDIIADPDRPLDSFEIMPLRERRLLAAAAQGPRTPYSRDASIAQVFAEVARRQAARPAVRQGDRSVTYAALDHWSDAIAARLHRAGIGAEDVVAIAADRSPALIAGLLGILKAGGAYLALDPALPDARVREILADAGAAAGLARPAEEARLSGVRGPVLALTQGPEPAPPEPASRPARGGGGSLAYVCYTSGSSGKPKGVCVEHRGVLRLVTGASYARLGPEERMLHLSSAGFDAATFEIWGALLNGATLVQPPEGLPSINALADLIRGADITTLWLTAGLFQQMVDLRPDCFAGGRQVLAGGDVLSADHVTRFLAAAPESTLINGYGPTENTTFSTACRITAAQLAGGAAAPIGLPIDNSSAHVLDADMRPVPLGVEGDLHVGGDGVARGYLGMPEATQAAFRPDPFAPGGRLYRTGDRARRRHDGTIDFLGRADTQIKIRGHRVELQEIEAALRRHDAVLDAAVVARRDGAAVRALAAFVTAAPGAQAPDPADLRAFLKGRLPDYMVPTEYRALEALPLNASGKIDRRRLLAMDGAAPSVASVAPRTPVEELVAEIWHDLLGGAAFGIDDDFFELGGHSLLAMQVGFRLEEEIGLAMAHTEIFGRPTIRAFAEAVAERLFAEGAADLEDADGMA